MHDGIIVEPGTKVRLKDRPADAKLGLPEKEATRAETIELGDRLAELGGLLAADRAHGVLVVIQGMDASGKDGTVRQCIGPLNPSSVNVTSFKAPTSTELSHDFLWRIHDVCPRRGEFAIFNRSHYEDVLIVRVDGLVPKKQWEKRYDAINAFEKNLVDEGTLVIKFFLHMSKDEQAVQMQQRLDDPTKNWKYNADDLRKREQWDDYMEAYEAMLERTSTPWAPWHVVPANRKWVRNFVVSEVLVEALEGLKMKWPVLDPAIRRTKIV